MLESERRRDRVRVRVKGARQHQGQEQGQRPCMKGLKPSCSLERHTYVETTLTDLQLQEHLTLLLRHSSPFKPWVPVILPKAFLAVDAEAWDWQWEVEGR